MKEETLIQIISILVREGTRIVPMLLLILGLIIQTGLIFLTAKLAKHSADKTWENNIANHLPKVTRQLVTDRDVVIRHQALELKVLREQVEELSVALQGALRQSNIINEILHLPAAQAELNVRKRKDA